MADCIDRERALAIIAMSTSKAEAEKGLRDLSAGNVPPVRRGRWERVSPSDKDGNAIYKCTECQCEDLHAIDCEVPYCWHCGADMRGKA